MRRERKTRDGKPSDFVTNAGYQRINPRMAPDAVIWWYVREYEDGFVFARGGRCRTTREARHILNEQMPKLCESEYAAFVNRPVAWMMDDGSLWPVDYGPYGIERRV